MPSEGGIVTDARQSKKDRTRFALLHSERGPNCL